MRIDAVLWERRVVGGYGYAPPPHKIGYTSGQNAFVITGIFPGITRERGLRQFPRGHDIHRTYGEDPGKRIIPKFE